MTDRLTKLFLTLTPDEQNAVFLWIENNYEHNTTDNQKQLDLFPQRATEDANGTGTGYRRIRGSSV